MRLSGEEQRQMAELERALASDDPRFVEHFALARVTWWSRLRRGARSTLRRLRWWG